MSLYIRFCASGEMVDTHALGACTARYGGSSPLSRTIFRMVTLLKRKYSEND